jgi:hypothetical protein
MKNTSNETVNRIPARVLGSLREGYIQIIVGAGLGMLDGGIHVEIPIELVPPLLRTPNSEFIAVQDRESLEIVSIEPTEE